MSKWVFRTIGVRSRLLSTFQGFGWAFYALMATPVALKAESAEWSTLPMSTSAISRSSVPASITIASRCEGDRQIAAKIYGDSIVLSEAFGGDAKSHVVALTGKGRQSADSLFQLLKGLGGALVLRCPNVEAVSCQFEATLDRNRLECTNCAACSDDLDRMSLATLHRFKALLRDLNLFL